MCRLVENAFHEISLQYREANNQTAIPYKLFGNFKCENSAVLTSESVASFPSKFDSGRIAII